MCVFQTDIIINVPGSGVRTRNYFQSDLLIIMLQYQEVVLYFGWMPLVEMLIGEERSTGAKWRLPFAPGTEVHSPLPPIMGI